MLSPGRAAVRGHLTLYTGPTGWEGIEDRLVTRLLDTTSRLRLIQNLGTAVSEASWRVISAIKANDSDEPDARRARARRIEPAASGSLSTRSRTCISR